MSPTPPPSPCYHPAPTLASTIAAATTGKTRCTDPRPPGLPGGSEAAPAPKSTPRPVQDNPFAPPARTVDDFNPFAPSSDDWGTPGFNPFAPAAEVEVETRHVPRKLRLLDRGRALFGTYAKVLLRDGEPAAFAQFGPLSAYQRAQRIRDLYPRLPSSPLPAVITCIATTSSRAWRGPRRSGWSRQSSMTWPPAVSRPSRPTRT